MKPFRYLRDPLFVFCLVIYFVNRLVIKRYLPNTFSRSYLNDVICIPFWVPIMLFSMRVVRLRRNDLPPASYEILIPLLVWSYVFECMLPYTAKFRGIAFGDPLDVASYAAGALFAGIFWRYCYAERGPCSPNVRQTESAIEIRPPGA